MIIQDSAVMNYTVRTSMHARSDNELQCVIDKKKPFSVDYCLVSRKHSDVA